MEVRIKKILAPTDFSERSYYAFNVAVHFALSMNASIVLFHVIPQEQIRMAREIMIEQKFTVPGYSEKDLIRRRQEKILKDFKKHFPDYVERGLDVTPKAVFGNPVQGILDAVCDLNIDLIVMGTHGRTGFNRTIIGSVAEKVIRHSPIPVTMIKVPAEIDCH